MKIKSALVRDLLVIVLTQVPSLFSALNPVSGDTEYYRGIAADALLGIWPYRDRPVDYPPYALVPMLAPALLSVAMPVYRYAFAALVLVLDAALKLFLLRVARQWQRMHAPERAGLAYLPFAIFSADVILQDYIYVKRFDVVPALLVTACVVLACRGWWRWAGVLLSAAVGVKLYPLLLAPLLLVVAWRVERARALLLGCALGALPIVMLSFVLPWWSFAAMQGGRGLQVESWAASLLWLAHFAGANVQWAQINGNYFDVVGATAAAWVPWVKIAWAVLVVGSCAWASWRARTGELSVPRVALLCLAILTAFVAFGNVLSPQYMIWLVPLAGLAALSEEWWLFVPFAVAMLLTPLSYPAPHYGTTGLALSRTLALVTRNACLGWSWWKFIRAV